MKDHKRNKGAGIWLLAAVAFSAGPLAAFLHKTDILSLGPGATLWPIAFVVALAAAGLMIGLVIAIRGNRGLGTTVAISNSLVLAFYGFLLLFFGLGGSR